MSPRRPPKKQKGRPTGPRSFDGTLTDVRSLARELGTSEKTLRAQVARRLLPFRRLGSRILFDRAEVRSFLDRLPGVRLEEALENVAARNGEAAPR